MSVTGSGTRDLGRRRSLRLRALFATLFGLVTVAGIALGVSVTVRGYSPVPFADFWGELDFVAAALDGDVGIGDFWAQHNEHRMVVARLQFLADYGLFGGTNVFLFAAIAASSIAIAVAYAAATYLDTRDWLLAFGTLAVGTAATLSPAGWENLTWAFQGQFVQVFLFGVLAVLLVTVAARQPRSLRAVVFTALAWLAATVATFSMANGLLVWPVVVGLAVVLSLGRTRTLVLAIGGAAVAGSYLWDLEFSTRGELSDPVGLATFVSAYLGSAVWGAGLTKAAAVGVVGLALVPVLFVLAWRRRSEATIAIPFAAGVAAFILLTAMQTAAGRLYLGTAQALSSRYSIASFTFWLAIMVALLVVVRERLPERAIAAPAYLAAAAAAALLVGYRTVPDPDYLRTVVFGKAATVMTYRVGVSDDSETVTGVAAGTSLEDSFRWMERERLGPWAPGGMVDGLRVRWDDGRVSRTCAGEVESVEEVLRGQRVRGWIEAPDGTSASRSLVVESSRARVGLGLVGAPRDDVDAPGAVRSWSGFVAYVQGRPTGPLSIVLLNESRDEPICSLVAPPG